MVDFMAVVNIHIVITQKSYRFRRRFEYDNRYVVRLTKYEENFCFHKIEAH